MLAQQQEETHTTHYTNKPIQMAPFSCSMTSTDMRTNHDLPRTVVLTSPRGGHDTNMSTDRRTYFKRKSSMKSLDYSSGSHDKSVNFSNVAIRDYSICPGDNPSVSRGVPLSLDWGYDQEKSQDIDDFELDRSGSRRANDDLKLPSLQRVQMLKHNGYSRGEINERVKEVERVKEDRISTRRKLEREDRIKKLKRKVVKVFGISKSKSSPGSTARDSIENKNKSLDVEKTNIYEKSLLEEVEDDTLMSSVTSKKSDSSELDCNVITATEW
jgi:hypothetical protein